MARRKGLPAWSPAARLLVTSLLVPLTAGGLFSLILWLQGIPSLVPSAMLVFYGLALFTSSAFTLNEVKVLAGVELLLGLAAGWLTPYGLLFWAVGFGFCHIAYGLLMYVRYER